MNMSAVKLFHELMVKKGCIKRSENNTLWDHVEDPEVMSTLRQMGSELGFEIIQCGNRLYLVPTRENDLFVKTNMDYKADVKEPNSKLKDLYLLNFITVYTIYLFFKGEGSEMCVRNVMLKEDLLKEFTEYCKIVDGKALDGKNEDFGETFVLLAKDWLSKTEGDASSKRIDDRYGVINKMLLKLKIEGIFTEETGGIIKPTQKAIDLMPYVLRKERAQEINEWLKGKDENNATD